MITYDDTDLEICVDCLMLIANGDTPPEMSETETAQYLAEIERNWGDNWHIHPNCDEDCEGWFSWSSCDICDRGLGGDRHKAIAYKIAKVSDPLGLGAFAKSIKMLIHNLSDDTYDYPTWRMALKDFGLNLNPIPFPSLSTVHFSPREHGTDGN